MFGLNGPRKVTNQLRAAVDSPPNVGDNRIENPKHLNQIFQPINVLQMKTTVYRITPNPAFFEIYNSLKLGI